jgi:hypothetical protein
VSAAGVASAGFPESNAEISSPSFPIIASNESTGAVSPAGIHVKLKDSNSIVALSVSISARMSPLTLSPTFFEPSCYRSFPSGYRSINHNVIMAKLIV